MSQRCASLVCLNLQHAVPSRSSQPMTPSREPSVRIFDPSASIGRVRPSAIPSPWSPFARSVAGEIARVNLCVNAPTRRLAPLYRASRSLCFATPPPRAPPLDVPRPWSDLRMLSRGKTRSNPCERVVKCEFESAFCQLSGTSGPEPRARARGESADAGTDERRRDRRARARGRKSLVKQ